MDNFVDNLVFKAKDLFKASNRIDEPFPNQLLETHNALGAGILDENIVRKELLNLENFSTPAPPGKTM